MNNRTDLALDNNIKYNIIKSYNNKNINILEYFNNDYIYHTIKFNNINNILKNIIKKELIYFFKFLNIKNNDHILIVGLGNNDLTSDSIGPKTIKHIIPNSHIYNNLITNSNKISILEPSVVGNTGINTDKIIKSITKLIKPNLVILIDSFITNNINNLNKTITLTNQGIIPGSGIKSNNNEISKKSLGIKVLTIGIPTALEINNYENSNNTFIMSTNNIDEYVNIIGELLGSSINNILYNKKL